MLLSDDRNFWHEGAIIGSFRRYLQNEEENHNQVFAGYIYILILS